MALTHWLNADLFSALRDKINAIVDFCNNLSTQPGVGTVPIGGKIDWWGNPNDLALFTAAGNGIDGTAFQGFAQCRGQALPAGSLIVNYDGSPRTSAPDMKGKVVASWNASDADFLQVGTAGGAKTVALTKAQIPKHKHGQVGDTRAATGGTVSLDISSGLDRLQTFNSEDGTIDGLAGAAHNNMQPYMTWVALIRFK